MAPCIPPSCTPQKRSFVGDALTVCMLWYLSIALISKNSLLKLALPEGSIAMSFRRDETGLPATREGAIERPKYRAVEGSCPLLVIVERETPDAAHTRHVGEDMSSPHACKCRPGQCSHGLSPHAAWQASPSGHSPHAPPPTARTAMRPRLLRGSVPEHAGLAPGPGPRGGPARSGGSGDPGARGQTFGVSTFSSD